MVSAVLVVGSCLLLLAWIPPSALVGWVGVCLTAAVPTLVVQTVFWKAPLPGWSDEGSPVRRGIAGLLLLALAAAVVTGAAVILLGRGRLVPDAFLMFPLICSVPLTLWLVFLLEGWPATLVTHSPGLTGLVLLFLVYGCDFLLAARGLNYAYLANSADYSAALDPHGPLDARSVVSILLAAAAATLALVAFDSWPGDSAARTIAALGRQPWRGLASIVLTIALASLAWGTAVGLAGLDEASFQARFCVSFIFGIFVLLVLFEGKAFDSYIQPMRGLVQCIAAAMLAIGAYQLYAAVGLGPAGVHPDSARGTLQAWVSTAMLAVTFPTMSAFADLFRFFPLRRGRRQ